MNNITMTLQADHLILEALKEDISSEDVSTNAVMREAVPGEVDLIYINFCDPWPPKGQAKRRLTHRGFLTTYRKVLKMGGEIHFKTDNGPLFQFSLEEFPAAGYTLSEVTHHLHENGPQGVMTDYEAKFYAEGLPINRCVGTMIPLPDSEETKEEM